jgi:folate-dependent phosphoribosylglycinamide formyltransferase PurN
MSGPGPPAPDRRPRTALICSEESVFNRRVLPAFLASFTDLAGIVVIRDTARKRWRRLRFEWRRSRWRILDVLAFRLYYRLRHGRRDRAWMAERAARELARLGPVPDVPVHLTETPNDAATREFLQSVAPDLCLAACKTILRPEIFTVPPSGTFVVHPGICPEYRNAHGCFWALARRDLDRVGATLIRIDEGVDTGPVHAYYRADIDERRESHAVIQTRVVYDNLDRLRADLERVLEGRAETIDVSGRPSAAWGQPRLTDHLRWKWAARRRASR